MAIKVLLADDVDIVRRAIRSLLKGESVIEIVGEAFELSQTIRMAESLNPHIIVMDLHMPNRTNVEASEVKARLAGMKLLGISVWNDDETKAMAESFGAITLLDKMKLGTELIPLIIQLSLPPVRALPDTNLGYATYAAAASKVSMR